MTLKRLYDRLSLEQGDVIPRGWAPSYCAFDRDCVIAYPIGIHLLVRWLRDLRFWIMWVGFPGYRDEHDKQLFDLGVSSERALSADREAVARARR